jgi:O-antigen ligase
MTTVLPFIALLGFIHVMQHHRDLRRQPGWWLIGAITVALTVLVSSPFGNSRYWFGTVLLGTLFSLRRFQSRSGRRFLLTVILAFLIVVFPYSDYFRRPDANLVQRPIKYWFVNKLDYDASSQITNGIQMHDQAPEIGGYQLVGAAAFFVPRPIWPDKPMATGTTIAEYKGFQFTRMSAPLWVEGYVDFGLIGTAALLALVGTASGRADSAYSRHILQRSSSYIVLVAPAAAAYMMIVLRGSLIATIGSGVLFLAVSALLLAPRPSFVKQQNSPRC